MVVYLAPGTGGLTHETYTESLFGQQIQTFRYAAVGLPDLTAEEYLELENVLAPALSALMKSRGTDRVTRKLRALQRIARADVDEARRSLLTDVVGRYLPLTSVQNAEMRRRVEQSELREVAEMINIYEERALKRGIRQGVKQGIVQGVEQGIIRGKRETLLRQMRHKFGEIPEQVVARIERFKSEGELGTLTDRVLDARSLDEMGLTADT